jgi:cytochrome P450
VLLLGYLGYLAAITVVIPYRKRKFYSQFKNVCMSEKFNPPMHELDLMGDKYKQNKHKWSYYLDYVDQGKDIHLSHFGYKRIFDLMSDRAFEDFDKNIPEKIDKYTDLQELSFAKTFFGAVMHLPTNKDWERRRAVFSKAIGLNFSSRYITLMLEHAKKLMDKWEPGTKLNFIPAMYKLTLTVISSILIGKDFDEKMRLMTYTYLDGTQESMDIYSFFPKLGKDLMAALEMPINLLFPTLIRNNIGNVNKTNMKNIQEFRQAFKDFLNVTEDENSCYKLIKREFPDYDDEDLFNDLQGFLFDGYETLADTFCTTVYFMSKHPHLLEKVRKDLVKVGIEKTEKLEDLITYDRLNELEFLLMAIKESLRIDPPLARSMHFYAKEDIKIAGVPLPKGSIMSMCFIARHYDPKVWQKPYEYIPERFDPESEYYSIPGDKTKARKGVSFVAFSHAIRKCPAPTFAYLELKVVLAYFLTRFDFEVAPELLENEHVRYGILSHFPLDITITKKHC